MIDFLTRLARPRSRLNVAHLEVTVYTRAQCCCCHKALDLLKDYQQRHGFRIEEIDIDADPELVALYDTTVPVVAVGGRVRFKGQINPVLFERLLLAESRGR
jgi:glutaredoxin